MVLEVLLEVPGLVVVAVDHRLPELDQRLELDQWLELDQLLEAGSLPCFT